jgi:hypothetical protein
MSITLSALSRPVEIQLQLVNLDIAFKDSYPRSVGDSALAFCSN